MTLQELLEYFSHSETIGENKEAVDMMRHFSREAQKITMRINTQYHEPEIRRSFLRHGSHLQILPDYRFPIQEAHSP